MPKPTLCLYCGTRPRRPDRLCPGCGRPPLRDLASRYEVREVLRVAVDTATLLAADHSTGRPVIIRLLRPKTGAAVRQRVVAEAYYLQSHREAGLPYPAFVDAGRLPAPLAEYTVRKYVGGQLLHEAAHGLRPADVLELLLACLEAVAPLHGAGLVHGDLKPGHFVLTPEGRAYLVDLRALRESGSASHGLGTPGYRPPEQEDLRAPVTCATDVYALGSMAYHLLTHRVPYPVGRDGLADRSHRPVPPSRLSRCLSPSVDALLLKATDPCPERRFADAGALRAALWRPFATRTVVAAWPVATEEGRDGGRGTRELRRLPTRVAGAGRLALRALARLAPVPGRRVAGAFRAAMVAGVLLWTGVYGLHAAGCGYHRSHPQTAVSARGSQALPEPARVRLLSWPATRVFCDGIQVGEAPSPESVPYSPGTYTFVFVARGGRRQEVSTRLEAGRRYAVEVDMDSGTHTVWEESR